MNASPAEMDLTAFGVVALLLAIAGVALWWWRARSGVAASGPIQLLALRPLGGKRLIALIEVDQERFLLGLTDAQISCLGRLSSSGEVQAQVAKGEAA